MAIETFELHPLELREKRFRLQQQAGKLEDGAEKTALEEQVAALQEVCGHANPEEGEAGWRCRDCDLTRAPDPEPEEEATATAEAAPADTNDAGTAPEAG